MKFGTEVNTEYIDDQGSTVSITSNVKNGEVLKPRIKETRIRLKVHNRQEEMREYLRFTDEQDRYKEQGLEKMALGFDYEYTHHGRENGYYFLILQWREELK